jgi:hypothetical protein
MAPSSIAAAVALAGLAALASYQAIEASAARADAAKTKGEFDAYQLRAEQQARQATEAAALETARRIKTQSEVIHAEVLKTQAVAADGDRAAAADRSLRDETARIAARGRAAAADPAIAADSQAAGAAAALLADLLGQCSQRRTDLALYADRARNAGDACQQSYDALTPQQ